MPAGADVGRDSRHAGRVALEDDQRQRFADRRQDGQADFRHQVFDLLEAEETDMVLQAQAAHQGVALGGVGLVLIFRSGDPAFRSGHPVDHPAHGADEGLDVLDRDDPADQAQHGRHAAWAAVAQRGQALEVDPVRHIAGALGQCAVGDLAQAVLLVEGDDGVGCVVAEAPQPLEKVDPHLAEIGEFRRVALEDVAVVADPLALEQLDLPLLGVDAVFGEDERDVAGLAQQGAEEAGIAGGDGVQRLDLDQPLGNAGQLPQRRMHDAHRPEEVDKGGVGAEALVALADQLPGPFAVQEILQGQLAAGHHVAGQCAEFAHGGAAVGAGREHRVHLGDPGEGRLVARAGARRLPGMQVVVKEMLLEMDDVGRQFVAETLVVGAAAA
ncbi:hypothetical protein SDC9_123175 [bioreactor metagenome]|uniref:Uncharacterized protein n=1 Tax=bioreactor metagenome TaxID=1076179 RepID=A0A645CGX0_9ZZZZ